MDRKLQIVLNLVVSLVLFALIIYLVGADEISNVVLNARMDLLALSVLFYLALTLIMSFRIKVVLSSMGEKLSLQKIYPSNLAGLLASDFTPARVGYFFTAFSLSSRNSIATEKTIATIFGPQLFDFLIKATSATLLTAMIVSTFGANGILLNIVLIVCSFTAILFAGLLVFYPPMLDMLSFLKVLPFAGKVFGFLRSMHQHSHRIFSVKWEIVWITLFSWLVKGTEWFLLSRAIGIEIFGDMVQDILFMMVFQGAITIIQFVPVPTLAGAGASEAGFAAILFLFGVPFEQSVAFGLLTRFVMIVADVFSIPVILEYLHKHSLEGTMDRLFRMH